MRRYSTWIACLLLLTACFDKGAAPLRIGGSEVKAHLVKVFEGFEQPVAMLADPGEFDVWYVVEKKGRIIRLSRNEDNNYAKSVYLDITDRVNASHNESGLLGMAFDPLFNENGYMYA